MHGDEQWTIDRIAAAVADDRYAVDVAYTVLVDLAFAGHVLRSAIVDEVRASDLRYYDKQRADARAMEARNGH